MLAYAADRENECRDRDLDKPLHPAPPGLMYDVPVVACRVQRTLKRLGDPNPGVFRVAVQSADRSLVSEFSRAVVATKRSTYGSQPHCLHAEPLSFSA
jgi:hypothetical protein